MKISDSTKSAVLKWAPSILVVLALGLSIFLYVRSVDVEKRLTLAEETLGLKP